MIGGIRSGSGRKRSGRFLRRRWRPGDRAASPEYRVPSNAPRWAEPRRVLLSYRSAEALRNPKTNLAAESNGGETKIPQFVRDDKGSVRDDKLSPRALG